MTSKASKKAAPVQPKAARKTNCSNCSGACGKPQAIRLDDRTIHALYFGMMAAVFELHNLSVQDETGAEHMNLRDSLDSAMETADTMMGLLVERRAK